MTAQTTQIFYPKNGAEAAVYFAQFHGKRLNITTISKFIVSTFDFNDVYAYTTSNQENFNIKKYRGRKWVSAGSLDSVAVIEVVA